MNTGGGAEMESEGDGGSSLVRTDFVEEGRSQERRGDQADTDCAAVQGEYSCMGKQVFEANITESRRQSL